MICKRGQSVRSIESYQKRWNWTRKQVRCFFDLLVKMDMITKETTSKTTIVTICNYDTYQGEQPEEALQEEVQELGPTKGQQKGQQKAMLTNSESITNNNEGPTEGPTKGQQKGYKQEIKNLRNNLSVIFDQFRNEYLGTKRGLITELENFLKKNRPETVELLLPALIKEKEHKTRLQESGQFVPTWKNLQTWINQRCWEQEFPQINGSGKRIESTINHYQELN